MKISQQKATELATFLMAKKFESLKKKKDTLHEKAANEYSKQIPKEVLSTFDSHKEYFKSVSSCYSLRNNHKPVRFNRILPTMSGGTPVIIFSEKLIQQIEDLHFVEKQLNDDKRKLEGALFSFSSAKRIIENFPELENHELLREPIKALVNIDEIKKLYK